MTQFKVCTRCGERKPATREYFQAHPHGKYGLRSICKACDREYQKVWRAKNPAKEKAKQRKYRERHPDKVRERTREYRRKNQDKYRATLYQWRAENKDKIQAMTARREARKRDLPNTFTDEDWNRALGYWGNACAICGRPAGLWHQLTPDHWIPLSHDSEDNPGTVPENIVPLCWGMDGCNNSKCNKLPAEWLVEKFGKRKAQDIIRRIDAYFEWVRNSGLDG